MASIVHHHFTTKLEEDMIRGRAITNGIASHLHNRGSHESNHIYRHVFRRHSTVREYLENLGIRSAFHEDVLKSVRPLLPSGDTVTEITVSQLSDAISDEGIVALSKSIQQQQKKRQKKANRKRSLPKRQIIFRVSNEESTLTWRYGESLLDLAQSLQGQQLLGELDNMEGPCGGQMNCSTCHVYLDCKTYDALPPPVEAELDMLDLAFEPKETSRLGCQVKCNNILLEKLDNSHQVVVTLPPGVNIVWET